MKKILILILFPLTTYLYGQCPEVVWSESFENYSSCSNNSLIQNGCAAPWCASHGLASMQHDPVCDGEWSGEIVTRMECPTSGPITPNDFTSEGSGMVFNFANPLEAGNYRISFCFCGKPEGNPQSNFSMGLNVLLSNSTDCKINNPLTDVLPPLSDGEQTLFATTFNPFEEGDCHFGESISVENLPFTTNQSFSQIWVYGFQANGNCFSGGAICIDDIVIERLDTELPCTEESDLTACAAEGDFGFIAIECAASFDWELPAGSTALIYTSATHSVLVNASEGTYKVKIIDAEGCIDERTFEIVADCCPAPSCELNRPENLGCGSIFSGQRLTWDPVPGALGYVVTIIPNGQQGECCSGPVALPVTHQVTTNYYDLTTIYFCATWSVKAICKGGVFSQEAEYVCLDFESCRGIREEWGHQGHSGVSAPEDYAFNVYPNPAQSNLNIEISEELTQQTGARITILDLRGKALYQEQLAPGTIRKEINLTDFASGVYFVKINTDSGQQLVREITIIQ